MHTREMQVAVEPVGQGLRVQLTDDRSLRGTTIAAYLDGFAGRYHEEMAQSPEAMRPPVVEIAGTRVTRTRCQAKVQPIGGPPVHDVIGRTGRAEMYELRDARRH